MSVDPLRVAYDVSGLRHRGAARGGVYRTTEALARGLAASKECDLTFCTDGSIDQYSRTAEYLQSVPALRGVPFRGVRSMDLRECDVLHWEYRPFPSFTSPARRGGRPKRFMTVHDLITVLWPHWSDPETARVIREALASLDRDDWIICGSQSAKSDLCNCLPQVDASRVCVIHHAASDLFHPVESSEEIGRIRTKYGIPGGNYVLCVNRLEQRKNMAHVVQCFAKLLQAERVNDLSLVLAGARGWNAEAIVASGLQRRSLEGRIVFTGFVDDQDLAGLYSGATVFVYPSFYEGFGLPPLEAMQCGTPVITSNTSALPEVVGDAGWMLDPRDEDGLCQVLLEVHQKASVRERMSSKSIARARMFSWEQCTRQTIDAYRHSLL